jgi:cytochrome c-type biogenesis protein CcmH
LVALSLLTAAPSFAVQPDEMLPDPALEARARTLSRELRCMVCQNQSIDDSEAPLARDLRLLVRELWLAPGGVLLLGAGGLIAMLLRRRRDGIKADEPQLTAAERSRLDQLLGEDDRPKRVAP